MFRKSIVTGIVLLFLVANFLQIVSSDNLSIYNIAYVDDDNTEGPWDGTNENPYLYIWQAIENSSKDYQIYIYPGLYNETILIDKQIKIIGQDKNKTIINGENQDTIITILSDNVSISGFTIKNSNGNNHDAGIKVFSDNVTISDCLIYRTRHGIILNSSIGSKIINCIIHTNGEGVFFDTSMNCEIIDTEFCHNAIGINIKMSQEIKIEKSYIHEHGIGILVNHSENITIINSAICDNNNNQGGCFIFGSENIKIYNSNIIHNGLAIRIDDSNTIIIDKCTFRFNAHNCVYLKRNVLNVTVTRCDIYQNLRFGIYVNDGECTVKNNNMYDNWIDSCHVKQGFCNASFNWWGSKFGPWFNGVKLVDLIKEKNGILKLIPWNTKPVTNTGAEWAVEDLFTKTKVNGYGDENIKLPETDTDNDGVPDWWEIEWGYNPLIFEDHTNIDEDGDALNNFEECYTYEYGSNPYKKDIFLEIDWMETKKTSGIKNLPDEKNINEVKERFAENDINLHVDVGQLGGGEEIPYQPRFNYDGLIDIYWDYFLHNDLENPRKEIFHYVLVCDEGASAGFEFMGWAHCNALCISSEILKLVYPDYSYQRLIILGIMHELGHTLGLFSDDHGGNDNRAAVYPYYKDYWIYGNYKSIMNYRYFLNILDYSSGDNGSNDFDDWNNIDYDFFKNTNFNWPPE